MTIFQRLQERTGVEFGKMLASMAVFPFYAVAWLVGFVGRLLRLVCRAAVLGARDGWGT